MLEIRYIILAFCFLSAGVVVSAQTTSKQQQRKNLTIKEWNTNASTNTRYLDHVTTYNEKGQKVEEIEYANYGQKYRITFEYNEHGKCVKQIEFDAKNKVAHIRTFEYDANGRKSKQYNYLPNGKLETTKVFEYITSPEK